MLMYKINGVPLIVDCSLNLEKLCATVFIPKNQTNSKLASYEESLSISSCAINNSSLAAAIKHDSACCAMASAVGICSTCDNTDKQA